MDSFLHAVKEIFTAKGSDLSAWMVLPRTVIIVIATLIYVRWAKKRFIAQASAIDLIMAVVIGSLMSRAINGGATLASTLVAGFTLVAMQRIFEHLAVRSKAFGKIIRGNTQVLSTNGVVDKEMLRCHNITEDEMRADLRLYAQTEDIGEFEKTVLEASGRISGVRKAAR